MQSRRDQIHSYQFFLHRVISSLVARQGDPAELPFRRLGGAALGSVMVAALMLAGAGVYGIIAGGGATSWKKGTFIIMVKDTAARYVYRSGVLHPVLNIASARLVLGQAAKTKSVSSKSLRGVPRGPQLGIPGAPDTLPARRALLSGGGILCTAMVPDGRGGSEPRTTLGLGVGLRATGTVVTEDRALLVREARDEVAGLHMVWAGRRFPIDDPRTVPALGAQPEEALRVAPEWRETLPVGPAIDAIRLDGAGRPSTALPTGALTGQVVQAPPGTFYLVRERWLEPITPLQKEIVLARQETVAAYPGRDPVPETVNPALLADGLAGTAPSPPDQDPAAAPPRDRPTLLPPGRGDDAACAEFAPGRDAVIRAGARLPDGGIATAGSTASGGLLADRVLVVPGGAALVRSVSAPGAPGGSLHLVTDQGIRYPLAAPEVARMLGYRESDAVPLPSSLVDRIPAGPSLDPVAAKRPA